MTMNTFVHNTLFRGLIFVVMAMGMFVGSSTAQANGNLEVVFNGTASSTPMFGATNFLPGDTATGTAQVTNNGADTETVHTDTVFESDPDGLGDHMTLVITDNITSTEWYNDLFGDFLDGNEVSLGDISPGETIIYTYTVVFDELTDNTMQEKSLSFDICVGFEHDNGYVCGTQISGGEDDDDTGDDNGGGGSGGGGGSSPKGGGIIGSSPLTIANERVDDIFLPAATAIGRSDGTALIRWETYRNGKLEPATSQVIYGLKTSAQGDTAPGYPYSINLTQPNFGYPHATVETDTNPMVTHHEVVLTGLEVGATYVYRVISHASPATVSYQHEFVIPYYSDEEEATETPVTESGTPFSEGQADESNSFIEDEASGDAAPTSPGNEYVFEEIEDEQEDELLKDGGNNALLPAGLGFLPTDLKGFGMCIFWLVLALLIMTILWHVYRTWRKKKGYIMRREEHIRFWILVDSVAIVVLYLFNIFCPIAFLIILLLILIIWYIKRKSSWKNMKDEETTS